MFSRSAYVGLVALLCVSTAVAQEAEPGADAQPEAKLVIEAPVEPGVRLRVWDVRKLMRNVHPVAPDQTPNVERIIEQLDLKQETFEIVRNFRVEASTTLVVDEAGEYDFRLTVRPGGVFTIDGEPVINLDGAAGPATVATESVTLEPGHHRLAVEWYTGWANGVAKLEWRAPGMTEFAVFGDAGRIDPSVVPVVSDGPKRVVMAEAYTRPGDGRPLESLHPAWRVVPLRPEGFEAQVCGMAMLPDGETLAIATLRPPGPGRSDGPLGSPPSDPDSSLYLIHGVADADGADDLGNIRVELVADDLYGAAGMYVDDDGAIYLTQRDGVLVFRDDDGDGSYETREPLVEDAWITDNYHHFTFGLVEKDGHLYTALSTAIAFDTFLESFEIEGEVVGLNGPNPPNRGSVAKIDLETGEVEFIAGGLRTPNGVGLGPDGEIFVTENQGAWMPTNKLNHIEPGKFYGYYAALNPYLTMPEGGAPVPFQDEPFTAPALWLPQNEVHNSPTEPLLIPDGPFAGQMLIGELTQGGIRRAFLEKVDGTFQGVVFRHTQGLEGGVNRLCWGDDGALYVGMIGRPGGNWNWRDTTFGLQKLVPTGESTFEMHRIEATPDGYIIHFTRPIDSAWLSDPANYRLNQFTYEPGPGYGGPKVHAQDLTVTLAEPATDGKSVRLVIPDLREGFVTHFHLDPTDTQGTAIWTTEAWYTRLKHPQ